LKHSRKGWLQIDQRDDLEFRRLKKMVSKTVWKRIWLFSGIFFIVIPVFMILAGPMLASVTGTTPFTGSALAMIRFFWIWMLIYNGIGLLFVYRDMEKNEALLKLGFVAGLAFTILQSIYVAIGIFPFIVSEVIWAVIPLIWTIIVLIYFVTKERVT
jgi:hypothetical protein